MRMLGCRMARVMIVRFGIIFCLYQVLSCVFEEVSTCTPGYKSELIVFKVQRHHLHMWERLNRRVTFDNCDERTRTLFQSVDSRFDVKTDGTVMLKRPVTLNDGHKVFSVHAWDFSGQKHTVSVRVECEHPNGHHIDAAMDSSSEMKWPSDRVLTIPVSSTGRKRTKRAWFLPSLSVVENSKGPFPEFLVQIKSDYGLKAELLYIITGEGADQDPVGIFTVEELSGNVYVTQPVDREKKSTYKLVVHAKSRDLPSITEEPLEIVVSVIDQNDNKPEFTKSPFNGQVPEAAQIDYEFMTVTATDADDSTTANGIIRYSIGSQEPKLPKPNMFDINSSTGRICVRETGLDREQWSKYTLEIVVADMEGRGMTTTGTAVITITDSNDNPPQFEPAMYVASVPENEVGHEVTRLTVTDGDEVGSPAWTTKYRIISGDNGGFFNVTTRPSQGAIQEGIITTLKPLDFEKTKQYILYVIVENDDQLVGSLPASAAIVTVNVEDVNEPPEFNPKERTVTKLEDAAVDTELVTYTATDPDIGKSQKITYSIGKDPGGWLHVSPDTGVIKVKTATDRESPLVQDGKYKATILAMDNDATSPATGTGTLVIDLEDVNDNAPVIVERVIKTCNREADPILLSITDKDGPSFAEPFNVEIHGETSKYWSTTMNGKSTGVYLRLKNEVAQGDYNVVLRVFDRDALYQDSSIQATVCDCTGNEVRCTDKELAGRSLYLVLRILGAICLLLLVSVLLLLMRRRSCTQKEPVSPEDDVRESICHHNEEGGGEEDQEYDLSVLQLGLKNRPEVFRSDVPATCKPAPQYRPRPAEREEMGRVIDYNLNAADNDNTVPPYDTWLIYRYEGEGSNADSIMSICSSSSGHDQDYDFLYEWGPRFKKLADMFGGGED